MYNKHINVEFNPDKEKRNIEKHGINFKIASAVFVDADVIFAPDLKHSHQEERWLAVGKIEDGRIVTVWFTRRDDKFRIIGAAEVRKWRREYEKRKIAGSIQTEMD